jgi:RNA polymerase sigma-70 factor (ECF subfamily)
MGTDVPAPSGARDDVRICTDAEVIEQSLADGERFGEIYHRYAADVHGFAARRLGPEHADDVTADTFVTAFTIRRRFDGTRESARPWLMGIAVRHLGHRRRAERSRYRMLAALPPAPPQEGPAEHVVAAMAAQSLRGPLAAAFAKLRAADRDVLMLIAWAELSYAEAAEALGVPIGTVRSRLSRARRVVRAALADGVDPTEEEPLWTT